MTSYQDFNQIFKPANVSMSYCQRQIIFYSDIDEESSYRFVDCVNRFISLDERTGEKRPIEILINSCGGAVYYGLTIISMIEKLKNMGYDVVTTNMGLCASMAFIISICGTQRKAFKYSVYMYHDISSVTGGKLEYMKEDVEELKKLKSVLDDIVLKYTNIEAGSISYWCNRKMDKYFYPEEALDLKIADIVE